MVTKDPHSSYFELLPKPFSEPAATDQIATSAAPLLAGFSFALIGIILTSDQSLRWPDLTLALLVVAALLLINTVQLGSIARRWSLPPAEWRELLDVMPEERVRAMHNTAWDTLRRQPKWLLLTRLTYNTGVVVLLAAVAFSLVPSSTESLSAWRIAAIAIAGLGAIGQAILTTSVGIRAVIWNRQVRGARPGPPFPGPDPDAP
jgi:hypothetical protein